MLSFHTPNVSIRSSETKDSQGYAKYLELIEHRYNPIFSGSPQESSIGDNLAQSRYNRALYVSASLKGDSNCGSLICKGLAPTRFKLS